MQPYERWWQCWMICKQAEVGGTAFIFFWMLTLLPFGSARRTKTNNSQSPEILKREKRKEMLFNYKFVPLLWYSSLTSRKLVLVWKQEILRHSWRSWLYNETSLPPHDSSSGVHFIIWPFQPFIRFSSDSPWQLFIQNHAWIQGLFCVLTKAVVGCTMHSTAHLFWGVF